MKATFLEQRFAFVKKQKQRVIVETKEKSFWKLKRDEAPIRPMHSMPKLCVLFFDTKC